MPNGFTFESPLNRLLNETVPRFIEGQLSRESRERMAMEEISFREEQNRLDRIQLQQEADLARKDRAIESEFNRRMKMSEQNRLDEMFREQKRINREKTRAESDESILESLDSLFPAQYLERTKDLTMSTSAGHQMLGDKIEMARMKVENSKSMAGLSDLLINPRAKAVYGKKLEMGDIDGALEFFIDTPNKLSPSDQVEASLSLENLKSLHKMRLPGNAEGINDDINRQIKEEKNRLRSIYASPTKVNPIFSARGKANEKLLTRLSNMASKFHGVPSSSFETGGRNQDVLAEFVRQYKDDPDLTEANIVKLWNEFHKTRVASKRSRLEVSKGRIGQPVQAKGIAHSMKPGRQIAEEPTMAELLDAILSADQ